MNTIVKYAGLLVGIGVFAFVGNKAVDAFVQNNSYITTDGVGFRSVEADSATLNISVVNESNVLKDIADKRKVDKDAVEAFLKKQGLEDSEIIDDGFNIEDQLRYVEKVADKKKYKVTDKVLVKTKKVKVIKELMNSLSELTDKNICLAGGNNYYDQTMAARYYYTDIKKLRQELIDEARKDAQERADNIAKSSGMQLGRLKTLAVGQFALLGEKATEMDSCGGSEESTSISKKVKANVTATFELK